MKFLIVPDYPMYSSILKNEKSEFEELFSSLSINVTNFFRDRVVYDKFRGEIIPKIMSDHARQGKIRVWSAGCASGEEAYSLAIMFTQEMGSLGIPIEIIANDISEKAIELAKAGLYDSKHVETLHTGTTEKSFRKIEDDHGNVTYEILPSIKNMISFKICDIFSIDTNQFDVIFCRNVLIYYEREAQELIINKFYHSLKDSGYMVLGMDETMLGRKCENLFHPLMARERIYQKVAATWADNPNPLHHV